MHAVRWPTRKQDLPKRARGKVLLYSIRPTDEKRTKRLRPPDSHAGLDSIGNLCTLLVEIHPDTGE